MRLSGSENLLTRGESTHFQTFTGTQLAMDALLHTGQELAGDWRSAALALAAPALVSKFSRLFRNLSFAAKASVIGEATLTEVGAALLARGTVLTKWSRGMGTVLGAGLVLTACGSGGEVDRVVDAGLAPPRSLEVQGAEFPVTPSVSSGTNQGFDATLNANGQLAVAWADLDSSNPRPSVVRLRMFPASGNPGNVVEVIRPQDSITLLPSISVAENGNILAAWTQSMGPDAPSGVFARRFSATGQAQGNPFPIVPLENHMPVIHGTVSMNTDGSFRVLSNENSASCGVCVRHYGANNIQSGVQTLSEANVPVLASHMATSAQGDWAWAGLLAGQNGQRQVRFSYFNADSGLGPSTTFSIGNPGTATGIQVAILPNDNSLLVWQSSQGLRGMVLNPEGNPRSSELNLNSLPPGFSFSVTSDEVGAFVVAWEEAGQIHATLLASDGRAISNNMTVSDSSSNNHEVVVSANERGQVNFVWRRFQSNPAGYSLVARNYQIRY